jgi:cytidylate kinase
MKKKSLVIAIDGPSASGKGTLAQKIARHFNLPYLNTGALYRLIAFRLLKQKIDPGNFEKEIFSLVQNIEAKDLEAEQLFGENIGTIASIIAKNQKLRAKLFDFQKEFILQAKVEKNGAVLEGRDTTTVICPDADYKFFVTADIKIRAQRRFGQLLKKGDKILFAEILAQLQQRDENDLKRSYAPLKIASDAIVIDNSNLSIEEGLQKILQVILASNTNSNL